MSWVEIHDELVNLDSFQRISEPAHTSMRSGIAYLKSSDNKWYYWYFDNKEEAAAKYEEIKRTVMRKRGNFLD